MFGKQFTNSNPSYIHRHWPQNKHRENLQCFNFTNGHIYINKKDKWKQLWAKNDKLDWGNSRSDNMWSFFKYYIQWYKASWNMCTKKKMLPSENRITRFDKDAIHLKLKKINDTILRCGLKWYWTILKFKYFFLPTIIPNLPTFHVQLYYWVEKKWHWPLCTILV